MPDFRILYIDIEPLHSELHQDDEEVKGKYHVQVNSNLVDEVAAGVALDILHLNVAIKCLDDFAIMVVDPDTDEELFQDDSYEDYSGETCGGDIWKV